MSAQRTETAVRRRVHVCLDIRGALSWTKKRLARLMRHESGRWATADEAREALLDEVAKGRKVLPIGEPCEGFDYQTGCPGHTKGGE